MPSVLWGKGWRDRAAWHILIEDQPYEASTKMRCGAVLLYPLMADQPPERAEICRRCSRSLSQTTTTVD